MPIEHKHNIDLTRYVALGDSITAGYTDGALYYEGQQESYANIIANQFKLIGGGDFRQPLMDKDSVGTDIYGNARLVLKHTLNNSDETNLSVGYLSEQGDVGALSKNVYKLQGPFNNMGVPGVKIITTLIPGFGNPNNGVGYYNPFFTRMASDPITSSILADVVNFNSTFFSLFIGNNDVLAYALSGGTLDTITPVLGPAGIGFEGSINAILNSLADKKGVVANIPDISFIPYFTTIPHNGLVVTKNNLFLLTAKYNSVGINFREGKNNFVISDPLANSAGIRQIKKGEYILLDILLDENKEDYLKGIHPIPKKYILTADEILQVHKTVKKYNTIIQSAVIERSLAFVDVNFHLKTAKPDRIYNEKKFNLIYKKRGVFSLDGLHPNAFGHVLLANEFIKAINTTYGTNIPLVKRFKIS